MTALTGFEIPIAGSYSYGIVLLSVVIAVLSSYTALELAGRISAKQNRVRQAWLAGGSIVAGLGIWSMHYIGILAFSMPIPVLYHWPTTIFSLIAAILASAVALFVVSRPSMKLTCALLGSLVIGAGISGMHYLGMAAMEMPATSHWSWPTVVLSIALAAVISFVALYLTFHFREVPFGKYPQKFGAALLMGFAISAMHYTGMGAVTFSHGRTYAHAPHSLSILSLGVLGVSTSALICLGFALLLAIADRRFSAQILGLEAKARRSRELLETAQVVLWQRNPESDRFSFVSPEAEALLGFPVSCWLAQPFFWESHIHDADRAVVNAHYQDALIGKQAEPFEHRMISAREAIIWVRTSMRLVSKRDGTAELAGVLLDITERKLAEEKLRERTEELVRTNVRLQSEIAERILLEGQLVQAQKLESIGQLAAGVAHEINTPIQYVGDNCRFVQDSFQAIDEILALYKFLLESLKDASVMPDKVAAIEAKLASGEIDFLREEIPQALTQCNDGVERVSNIVRAMKEFSHPGSANMELVNLNHAVQNTLTVCKNEWKYVAEVVTDFDCSLPPVRCLIGELNQVVLNLAINAAHAIADSRKTGELGRIVVSTRQVDDWVEIRVQDSGTGIPEAIQPKIFDPFFTTKEVGKGTGQGLAIARNVVVKKHGGTLTFETKRGSGTTFLIRLPVDGKKVDPKPAAAEELIAV